MQRLNLYMNDRKYSKITGTKTDIKVIYFVDFAGS